MKRFALLLFLTAFLPAQSPQEVEITAEPHHHQVFANDQVRVFNVDVPPHAETFLHRHGHDYIYVMFGASEIVNAVQGKDPVNVKLHDAQVGFTPGAFAHIVRNLDQPFRNVTIELLQDDKLRHSPAHWDPAHPDDDRGLEILHGGTQEILFVKDGVRVTEFELQPGGVVPAHRYAGPHLLVAVTDLDLRNDIDVRAANPAVKPAVTAERVLQMKSGDHKWLPANYSHTITNTGSTTAKFVTLEFPE